MSRTVIPDSDCLLQQFFTKRSVKHYVGDMRKKTHEIAAPAKKEHAATPRIARMFDPKQDGDMLLESKDLAFQDDQLTLDDDVIILGPLDFQIKYEHDSQDPFELQPINLQKLEQDQIGVLDSSQSEPEDDSLTIDLDHISESDDDTAIEDDLNDVLSSPELQYDSDELVDVE